MDYEIVFNQDRFALETYERLRLTGVDIKEIGISAKNTGLSVEEATTLKQHLFLTKHENLVNYGEGTYFADYFQSDMHLRMAGILL
ncbi:MULTISPECIES: hypothetical protein [Bacillus]|uniref:Uncharacterized protein n=1 Tax=Bacillus pseudomycoides TaxID=64104 RepID=A0AAJ1Z9E5_9BACI|nr:hypothetical protein [Bacillus pseudomycoides]MCR8859821.1 hypothetical protein [Bacillus pseudomycoides]MDR4328761.1 hypothetical protein [Bacillus pseudomycoides]MED1539308.1 hypothetical protein [Bacillus pseudomycoides]MED1619947.1 hypothetical protein [Bacillus pseudomycoides]PEF21556.1 hypothetical protein CON69_27190 [Bacillus pseudomycoides]